MVRESGDGLVTASTALWLEINLMGREWADGLCWTVQTKSIYENEGAEYFIYR